MNKGSQGTAELYDSTPPGLVPERELQGRHVSTHCMALVYPISQLYLCTELKILFLWTLLIVF